MAIESVIDRLNIEQREGIFQVPEVVTEDLGIKGWLKRRQEQPPVVIEEEAHYKQGIEAKLRASVMIITHKLARLGLIRPRNNEDFTYKQPDKIPISTLSLAQTVSWMHQTPIEEILISEQALQEQISGKNPAERVKILFHAYIGCHWFEHFRKKQQRLAETLDPPKVRLWQRISMEDLADWFLSPNRQGTSLRMLYEKGFITPRNNGRFRTKSMYNIVDPVGLAQLIALLYDTTLDNILVKEEKNEYWDELATQFIERRLFPCMKDKGINPNTKYSLTEASKLIGKDCYDLGRAVDNSTIPKIVVGVIKKISGIDLALYALKRTDKKAFTHEDMAHLFGVEEIDTLRLGIQRSRKGTYSRINYIYPVYDSVAGIARERVIASIGDPSSQTEIEAGGTVFYLDKKTVRRYCRSYGLIEFGQESIVHIREQLEKARLKNSGEELVSEQLIFRLNGCNTVTGIRMNTRSYKH